MRLRCVHPPTTRSLDERDTKTDAPARQYHSVQPRKNFSTNVCGCAVMSSRGRRASPGTYGFVQTARAASAIFTTSSGGVA